MNFIKKLANGNNISIKVIEAEIKMEILITDNNDKTILEFIVYESDFIQTFIDAFEKENLEIVYE
jgi:GT2 family glycosyltransferase